MPVQKTIGAPTAQFVAEMREFAGFPANAQRYIRRSLDVGLTRRDAIECWARNPVEAAGIRAQAKAYRLLEWIRVAIPDDVDPNELEPMLGPLTAVTAFDLNEGKLPSFAAYRFLSERLLGPASRPWLPSAFCAAAALPLLHPDLRRTLLQSITERAATAPGWSSKPPIFYPEWVEKIEEPVDR